MQYVWMVSETNVFRPNVLHTMKNCRIYLALSLCFVLLLFCSNNSLQAQNRLGVSYWKNTEPRTSVITELYIDDHRQNIIVYENCYDGPCTWGRETLNKRGNDYWASYILDFVEYRFRVRIIDQNRISVLAKMKYQDSDEWDYLEYSFRRNENRGNSGGISTK